MINDTGAETDTKNQQANEKKSGWPTAFFSRSGGNALGPPNCPKPADTGQHPIT
jgi:hypothetical protein